MFAGHWTRGVVAACYLIAINGFVSTHPVGNDYERTAGKGVMAGDEGAGSSRTDIPVDLDLRLYNPTFQQPPPAATYSYPPVHPGYAPMPGAQPGVGASAGAVWTQADHVPHHFEQTSPRSDVHFVPSLPVSSAPTEVAEPATVGQPWWKQAPSKYATDGEVYERWTQAMRTILGNPYLQFSSVGGEGKSDPRVVVAQDRLNGADRLVPPAAGERMVWESLEAGDRKKKGKSRHFLFGIQHAQSVKMDDLDLGHHSRRTYVYLDSRANMEWYNHMYFGSRLRFIPIRAEGLSWKPLNYWFAQRILILVLPPQSPYGLPLLVARHTFQGNLKDIEGFFPEGIKDQTQIVSLWSPALHGMDRTTMVLYGIAQLDMRDDPRGESTVRRLEAIVSEARGAKMKASFDIFTELPHILL